MCSWHLPLQAYQSQKWRSDILKLFALKHHHGGCSATSEIQISLSMLNMLRFENHSLLFHDSFYLNDSF